MLLMPDIHLIQAILKTSSGRICTVTVALPDPSEQSVVVPTCRRQRLALIVIGVIGEIQPSALLAATVANEQEEL